MHQMSENRKKNIVPYDPEWKIQFEKISAVCYHQLRGLAVNIQHVGSTAIPGMVAKPVLDMDIIIEEKELLPEITKRLEALGYIARGDQGIAGRYAFRQSSEYTPAGDTPEKWPPHHLYVCFADSLAWRNHLLFRDMLRSRPDLAEAYATLKLSLASDPEITKADYTSKKTDFVIAVLALAGLDETALKAIAAENR
jgi:GrpB-like predicted nucleotidyltransferase (UPF0157 family)